jgi:hypothetical protein
MHPLMLLTNSRHDHFEYKIIGDGLREPVHGLSPHALPDIKLTVDALYDRVNTEVMRCAPDMEHDDTLASHASSLGAKLMRQMFQPEHVRVLANAVEASAAHGFGTSVMSVIGVGDDHDWIPWESLYFPPTGSSGGMFLSDRTLPCRIRFRDTTAPREDRRVTRDTPRTLRLCSQKLRGVLQSLDFMSVASITELYALTSHKDVVMICAHANFDADALQLTDNGPNYDVAATHAHPLGQNCVNFLLSCGTSESGAGSPGPSSRNAIANALADNCNNTVVCCTCLFPESQLADYVTKLCRAVDSQHDLVGTLTEWYRQIGTYKRFFQLTGQSDWPFRPRTNGVRVDETRLD